MASIPAVLQTNVRNEAQDLTITTDVIEPVSLSQQMAVFTIPKKSDVLDSKSALKIRVAAAAGVTGAGAAAGTDISGKWLSGLLGHITAARLFAGGQLLSELRDAGHKVHLDKCFEGQEFRENYCDVKHGSCSEFRVAERVDQIPAAGLAPAQSSASGSIRSVDAGHRVSAYPYFRGVGAEAQNNGLEYFVLLEEIFPMLKDLQLPVRHLRDEVRIEIDFSQQPGDFLFQAGVAAGAVAPAITVTDCVIFADYIAYAPEVSAALEETLMTTGVSIPYRQTATMKQTIAGTTPQAALVSQTQDILLGMEGRSVMKVYCAKQYADSFVWASRGGVNVAQTYQGRCRSERLLGESLQMVVNANQIFDQPVVNNHEAYAYASFAGEKPFCAYPDTWEYNANYGGVAPATDVLWSTSSDGLLDQTQLGRQGDTAASLTPVGYWKDGFMGTQNYIGVDLAKYSDGPDSPLNGMRIGATPIILRLGWQRGTATGGAGGVADTRTNSPISLTVFVEYLRMFELQAGAVSLRDM